MKAENNLSNLVVPLIVLSMAILAIFYLIITAPRPNTFSIPNSVPQNEYDKEIKEIQDALALGYQVDVEVTSSHIAGHDSSSKALRCLSNNGNVATFSETSTRRLHILCWYPSTKTLFDIIINRINYYVDKWANPKSQLITAYAPEGVQGANMLEKSTFYINHLVKTIGGKIVNLKFGPGEIMFTPK